MKYAWIDQHRDESTVSRLCRVLAVSRSGYCQWRVRGPSARTLASQALDAKVAVIHRDSRRSYGRPRIVQQLRQQGECVVQSGCAKASSARDCARSTGRRTWSPLTLRTTCRSRLTC